MGHANNNYELRLKNLLARYLGTNSFHNFSSIDERRIEKRKVKDKMRMDKRGNIIHRDNIQENPGPPHCDTDQVEILEGVPYLYSRLIKYALKEEEEGKTFISH